MLGITMFQQITTFPNHVFMEAPASWFILFVFQQSPPKGRSFGSYNVRQPVFVSSSLNDLFLAFFIMLEVPAILSSSTQLYLSVIDSQHPSLAAWRTSETINLPMSFWMFWWVTGGLGATLTFLKISLIKLWSKSSGLHDSQVDEALITSVISWLFYLQSFDHSFIVEDILYWCFNPFVIFLITFSGRLTRCRWYFLGLFNHWVFILHL